MSDLKIKIANRNVDVEWENKSAVQAIMNKLSAVKRMPMSRNGIRQVGSLGIPVPRNDRNLMTKPGDIAVSGDNLVLFAGEDDVSCTKLGHIKGASESSIKNLLAPASLMLELYEG